MNICWTVGLILDVWWIAFENYHFVSGLFSCISSPSSNLVVCSKIWMIIVVSMHHPRHWPQGVPALLYNLPQSSSLPICHFPLCREWQGLPGWPTPLLNPQLCDWNRTFHDQEPMCPIHDMCKNALLPGIWNFHCVFYLITLVDSEIRSKCNLYSKSAYCIASPLNYIARAKRHLSQPFLASLTLSFLHSSYLRIFSLSLYWMLCKLSFYAFSHIL